MNNNCVIYARFSSHGQNEQSIESQIRTCKEFADSKGYNVIGIYSDKAKTGTIGMKIQVTTPYIVQTAI